VNEKLLPETTTLHRGKSLLLYPMMTPLLRVCDSSPSTPDVCVRLFPPNG
jgi:hypothetical protein